jgi:hypothetical protein
MVTVPAGGCMVLVGFGVGFLVFVLVGSGLGEDLCELEDVVGVLVGVAVGLGVADGLRECRGSALGGLVFVTDGLADALTDGLARPRASSAA